MKRPIKTRSHLIAAVTTLLVHVVLLVTLSINFSGESSSMLSEADMESFEMNMEDLTAEDIPLTPPGKDPTSTKDDKASESLSKGNSQPKTPSAAPLTAPSNDEAQEPAIAPEDTIIKKIEVVQPLKIDTVKDIKKDSVLLANLLVKAQVISKSNPNNKELIEKQRQRYEFYKKNFRSIYNFKKVYPYALKTKEIMDNVNKQLSTMTDESAKKKLIKETEKTLFSEYEKAVRSMSTSQGKLLLKLICRETNRTGFQIIKEYKGGFSATFWYGVGKIFGTDLKTEYHKEKEDSIVENILTKYNSGDLY